MTKVFQNITSFFLAGIVLISSTGINLHKHTCLKKGISEVAIITQKHDCCEEIQEEKHCHNHDSEEKKENEPQKNSCCDSKDFFIKTKIESNNFSIDNFVLIVFWTIAPEYFWKIYPLENKHFITFTDSSPFLKSGQEHLLLYQNFRL